MGATAPLTDPPEPHGGECGRVSGRAEPSLRTAPRNRERARMQKGHGICKV